MKWISCPTDSSSPKLRNHTTIQYLNSLWIFGGIKDTQQNKLYSFNLKTHEFKRHFTSGMTPGARESHTASVFDTHMYIIGGWTGHPPYASHEIFSLDLDTLRWAEIFPTGEVVPCNMHSAEIYGDSIYIYRGGDGRNYFSELYAFNITNCRYYRVDTAGRIPSKRADQTTAIVKELLVMTGGWNGFERLHDMWVYDIKRNYWSEVRQSGSVSRFTTGMTLSVIQDQLIMFGGSNDANQCTSEAHVASLSSFAADNLQISWEVLNISDKPAARFGHTATTVSKYQVVVYGGRSEINDENSLYVLHLDPMPVFTRPERNYTSNIMNKLKDSFRNPVFSDITLVIQGIEVKAHKMILACMSERFRAMLESGMIESQQSKIVLTDITYQSFLVLLRYMYTGELSFSLISSSAETSTEEILECLEGSDLYMILELRSECEYLLLDRINLENMKLLKQFAENYNLQNLDQKVSWFMRVNNEITYS